MTNFKLKLILRNFGLLSFGDEAEDEEEDLANIKFKAKSAHDIGDPTLLAKKLDVSKSKDDQDESSSDSSDEDKVKKRKLDKAEEDAKKEKLDLDSIKSKLKKKSDQDDQKTSKSEPSKPISKLDEAEAKR